MSRMPLVAHLVELQRRLKICLVFFGGGLVVAFFLRQILLDMVRRPHQWAMGQMNLADTIYVFRYQDNFIIQLKICIVAALVLSFPCILYQGLKFIEPGLLPQERKSLFFIYLPALLLLFLSGAVFSYFLLIPYGLYFLVLFGTQGGLFPLISFSDYVSLFLMLIVVSGLIFELPLLMMLLTNFGFVSAGTFRQKRRLAILIFVIVAAIVTPPDPVTQILLAIPLIFLYEIGIMGALFLEKKQKVRLSFEAPPPSMGGG